MREKTKPAVNKPLKISYKSLKESTSNKLSNIRKRLSTISSLDSGIGWLDEYDNEEFSNSSNLLHDNNSQDEVDNLTNNTNNTTNYEDDIEIETTSKQTCDRKNDSPFDVAPLKPTDCITSKFIEIIDLSTVDDKHTENTISSSSKFSLIPIHRRTKNTLIKKLKTSNAYNSNKKLIYDPSKSTHSQISSSSYGDLERNSSDDLLDIPSQSNDPCCPEIEEGGDQRSKKLVKSKKNIELFKKIKLHAKKLMPI